MKKFGFEPILECHLRSEFYDKTAYITQLGGTIYSLYAHKYENEFKTNLCTLEDCYAYYSQLWDIYFQENADLYKIIRSYQGFSDLYTDVRSDSPCSAREIYRLWVLDQNGKLQENMAKYGHMVFHSKSSNSGVYCGRHSNPAKGYFGNDFSHLPNTKAPFRVNTIEQSVAHFRWNFIKRLNTDTVYANKCKDLKGKSLRCWCSSPEKVAPCHCFILAAYANS